MNRKAAPVSIGILLGDRDNSFWPRMEEAYLHLAPELDLAVRTFYAFPEGDREAQLSKLISMLDFGYQAVVVNPLDRGNLVPGILAAAEHGLPVFDVGAKMDPNRVHRAGSRYIPVPTVDFHQQGRLGGGFIREALKHTGGRVAVIEGRADAAQSIGRCGGAVEALSEDPAIQLAWQDSADFSYRKAFEVTSGRMVLDSNLQAIFCANDLMALGAARAVENLGKTGQVLIVGVDLIDEARSAIRRGMMSASVAFSAADVARLVLETVIKSLGGAPVSRGFPVPSRLIHKNNLDEWPM